MMKRPTLRQLLACLALSGTMSASHALALEFYDISSIESSTVDTDYFIVDNLIEGPGVGFSDVEPYDRISNLTWVTTACGFPCDYYDSLDTPELTIDLGRDVPLNEVNVWGYATSNANGIQEFKLTFATAAEGTANFGKSITYSPTFSGLENDEIPRQAFPFTETVTARFVKLMAIDNFFIFPGDNSLGNTPGGDRVGLGEIAFPKPSGGLPGDFNLDGKLDVADIDALTVQSANGQNNAAYDLTKDAKVDVNDVTMWAKQLKKTWIGDANVDGEFSSADFVSVFQGGKFETNDAATWSQGDWNGDGTFGSGDFVAAFQDGGFEKGPVAAVSAVPEPASLTLFGLAAVGLLRRRRVS